MNAATWGGRALIVLGLIALSCAAKRGTIGSVIGQQSDGRLIVREAPPGLAAARAGVQEGDEILLIDGVDVRRLDARGVHEALSGEVGEPVNLTLLRGDRVIRVTVERTPAGRRFPERATVPRDDG